MKIVRFLVPARALPSLMVTLAILIALCLTSVSHLSFGQSEDASDPKNGAILADKFKVISVSNDSAQVCSSMLQALNRPTIYEPDNLYASLLLNKHSYIWLRRAADIWKYPTTIEDLEAEKINESEYLMLDLDQDGRGEHLVRWWLVFKGQIYTEIAYFDSAADILVDPSSDIFKKHEIISYQTLFDLTQSNVMSDAVPDSSFYLIDILQISSRPYAIALSTVESGVKRQDRLAFVISFTSPMKPRLECIFKTTMQR